MTVGARTPLGSLDVIEAGPPDWLNACAQCALAMPWECEVDCVRSYFVDPPSASQERTKK
jgi:hypothetical protein